VPLTHYTCPHTVKKN